MVFICCYTFQDLLINGNVHNIYIYILIYSYEPELFPGLIYRMVKPRIVLLIFVSGKVVLTGKFLNLTLRCSNLIKFAC